MPRQARIDLPGLLYHVMVRGIERKEIFPEETDKEDFLERLEKSLTNSGASVFAWSIMPNHAHILIMTGEKKLSRIMRGLLSGYATNFNIRHKRTGHLFQNRYKAVICEEDEYLLELVRYIHLNPLRAEIVMDMEQLKGYQWTGHSVLMGRRKNEWQETEEVLERFGRKQGKAREKYEEFVNDGISLGKQRKYAGGGLIRSAGGIEEVLKNRRAKTPELSDERILGGGGFVESVLRGEEKKDKLKVEMKKKLDIGTLIDKTAERYGLKGEQIKGKSRIREIVKARAVAVNIGIEYLGVSGREFEKELNRCSSGISHLYRIGGDVARRERGIIDGIVKLL